MNRPEENKTGIFRGFLWKFPKAIENLAALSDYGMEKHNKDGHPSDFLEVESAFLNYTEAMGRHLVKESQEARSDDGFLHCAQTAWNAMARLEVYLTELQQIRATTEGVIIATNELCGNPIEDIVWKKPGE